MTPRSEEPSAILRVKWIHTVAGATKRYGREPVVRNVDAEKLSTVILFLLISCSSGY